MNYSHTKKNTKTKVLVFSKSEDLPKLEVIAHTKGPANHKNTIKTIKNK